MKLSTLKALGRFTLPYSRRPSYLLFFATSRCRASCGHCFYWKQTNRTEQELSLNEIELLARSLGNVLQVTITGGMPELRDDLADIAIIFAQVCKPVNMTLSSNGGEPEKLQAMVIKTLAAVPDLNLTVDISLDGLFEEHNRLRHCPGLFDKVCRSFTLLAAINNQQSNLRLGMGLCVSGLNNQTAEATARWAIENLPIDNLTPILVRGEPRDPAARSGDPAVFLKVASLAEERLIRGSFSGYSAFSSIINAKDIVQKQLIAEIARTKRSRLCCSALRETAVVYPDGSIPGCELRDQIIGNLRDVNMDIAQIWKSPVALAFRKRITAERCFCWHQCFLSSSIMKSMLLWPRLLKNVWKLRRNRGIIV